MIVGGRWFSDDTGDPYAEQVREALEPVKDRVIITGYVPYDRIAAYYAAADAAVLPSIWEEPASLAVQLYYLSFLP